MRENTSEEILNKINDKLDEVISLAYNHQIPIFVLYEPQANGNTQHCYKVLTPHDLSMTVEDDRTVKLSLSASHDIDLLFRDEKINNKRSAINDALNDVIDEM